MKQIPHAFEVGSLTCAQVCTRLNILCSKRTWEVSDILVMDHLKAAKKVMRYLQHTKYFMLTFSRSDELRILSYADSYYAGSLGDIKSMSSYVVKMNGGAIHEKVLSRP